MIPLVLASASPRRRELLQSLGLEPEVIESFVDETVRPEEGAASLVARLAAAKAAVGAALRPSSLVVAADTTVVLGDEIINKPASSAENRDFLLRLSGREHVVFTGHSLRLGAARADAVVATKVRFRQVPEAELDRYVASGEGLDKAGGYAIQGRGAALVEAIEGCYSNVVGLSLPTVVEAARRLGVELV